MVDSHQISPFFNLQEAFSSGKLRAIFLANGEMLTPPQNVFWLLLSGVIAHLNGTQDILRVQATFGGNTVNYFQQSVAAADAAGNMNLFGNLLEDQTGWVPVILSHDCRFYFSGTSVRVVVLEWSGKP